MRLNAGIPLAQLKAEALVRIDTEAEAERNRYITAGSGQSMEYARTENEARWFLEGTAEPGETWPWLDAEVLAKGEVPGPVTRLAAAQEVVGNAELWTGIGAAIKQARRAAKIAVEAATTPAGVAAAATVTWPAP